MSVPGSGSAQYIIEHYHLRSISAAKHQQTVITLITNGLYYQQVNNPISALVSFSSAASYIYALKESAQPSNKRSYDTTLNIILGHVEALQQKTQMIGTSDKKDDEDVSWAKECINMCETKSNSLCLTFADVIGMTKEKNTMVTSIIKPLVYPNLFTKSAKGVLLYGPPGTGKTYLVKALVRQLQIEYADSAQVLFFPLTGADLKGKYVGETEKKIVRAYTCAARRACQATDPFNEDSVCTTKDANKVLKNLSESAQQKIGKSPQYVSVIFIDEFDSIGGDRSNDDTGLVANSVNTLLQMMDGIVSFKNIITVAATNYPWSLDPALLRRFNEHIYCTVPSINHIKQLVEMEMKQRFEIQKKNQRDYCAVDIDSKVFKPSQELAKFVGQKKEKGGCGPSVEERIKNAQWPLNIIDRRYMAMDSPEAEALIVYMKTENYSNSDIASVVQKAYNIASEACINDGTWFRITPGAKSFIEEATTELANLEKGGADATQIKLAKSRLEVLKAKAEEELAREAYVNQIQQLGQLIAIPIINTAKEQHNQNYAAEVKYYEDMLASIQKDKKQLAVLKLAAAAEERGAEERAQATGGGGGGTVATPHRDAFTAAEEKFAETYRNSEKETYLSLVEAIHKYNRPSGQTFKTVEEKILAHVSLDEHELSRRIKQLYEEKVSSDSVAAPPPASAELTRALAAAKAAHVRASENLAAANKAVTDAEAALGNIKKQYWATSARMAAAVAAQNALIDDAQRAIEPLREELAAAAAHLNTATEAMPADPPETKKYKASLDKFLKPLPPYKQGIIENDVLPACDAYLQAVSKSVIANSNYILDAIPSAQSLKMDKREEVGKIIMAILQKPRRPDITDMLSDFAYAVAEFVCMRLSRQDIKLTEVPKHYAAALEKAETLAKGDDNSACQYKIAYLRLVEEKDKLAKLIDKGETDTADIDAQITPITDEIEIHTKILNILGGTYTAVEADPTLVKEMQDFFTSKLSGDADASAPANYAAAHAAWLAADLAAYLAADDAVTAALKQQKKGKAAQEAAAKAAKARTAEAREAANTTREMARNAVAALVERLHSDQDFLNKVVSHKMIKDRLTSEKRALNASKELIEEFGVSTDGPLDYWEVKQRFYREKYLYEQRVAAKTEEFVEKTKEYIYYDLLVSVMKPTAFKNSIQKSEEYFISKMTKIIKDVDPNTYNLIDSAATQLDKQAKQDSIYDNGHTESKLQVPPTVIIDMFGGSSKNIFGNTKKTRMITSINFYSKKYINSKLIKDRPAELIFKDDSIADIFFTVSDVKTYRAAKSNIDAHKNTFIQIMFTRVISVMNDNAAAVILPKKHGITDTFEKITGHLEIFNAKEVLGTNEAVTLITLLEPLIEYDPEIKAAHDALVRVRDMPVEVLYGTTRQKAKTEAFQEWINIYQDYFSTYDQQKIVEVALAYYTEKKSAIGVLFSGKRNGNPTADACFAIDKVISSLFIFANNFADCIDDITKEELTEAKQHYGPLETRTQVGYHVETEEVCTGVTYDDTMTQKITNSVDHIIKTLTDRQIDAFKVSENGDPAKTVKKVFFFLAKIRPFGAAWTQFKAGGLQWSDGVGSTVSGWWQRFRSTWSTAAKAAHIQTITDNEIRAEIAKNKRTVADYLLLRTTHVGICNGENDSTFYEIADEEIKDQKLCPEIPEEDDEEVVSFASTSASAPNSAASPTEAKAIENYKAARAAAIALRKASPTFAAAVQGMNPDDPAQENLNMYKKTGMRTFADSRKTAITLWQQALKKLTSEEQGRSDLDPHIITLRRGGVPRQGGGTRKNYRARANITRRIGGASAVPDPVARNKTAEKGVDDSQPQNIMWFVIPLERTSIDLKLVPRHLAISLFGRVWLPADEKEPYWPNLVIAAMFMNDNFIVNKLSSDFSNFSESFNINYHKAVVQRSSYINKVLNTLNFKLIRYDPKYDVGSWYEYIPYFVAAWGVNSASSKYFGKSIVMCVFDGIKSATGTIHDYFIPPPLLPPIVEPPASANPIVAAGALAAPTFEFAPGPEPEVLKAANAALPVLKHRAAEAAAAQIASAANSQIVDLAGARGLKAAEEVAEKLSAVNAALTDAADGAKDAALAIVPTEASIMADIAKAQQNLGHAQAAVQAFRNTGQEGAAEALEQLQKVVDSNLLELHNAQGNLQAATLLRTNMDQLVSSVIDKMKGWIAEPPPVPAPPPTAAAAIVATDPYAMYKAATALGLDAFVLSGLYTQDAINHFTRAASLNDMLLRAYIELETELKIPAKDIKRNNIKRWLDKYNTVKWDNLSPEEKNSYAPFEDCTLHAQAGGGWSQEQYDSSATSGAHEEDEEYEEYEEYKEDEEDMIDDEEDMMDDEDDAAQSGGSEAPPGITSKPPKGTPPAGRPPGVGQGSATGLTPAASSGIPLRPPLPAGPPPVIGLKGQGQKQKGLALGHGSPSSVWRGAPPSVRTAPSPSPPAQGITQAGQAPHGHGAASSPHSPPPAQGITQAGQAPHGHGAASSPHSPPPTRASEPAGALSHGSGAASSRVVPSPPLTGSQDASLAPLSFLATGRQSASPPPPAAAAPPPPPPPARPFNKDDYVANCNELEIIFKKPSLTKDDICRAYNIFCHGALAAGTGGITLDIKGKYMLILIKFIAKAIPQKAKADMPKMDSVSSSLYNKIISPFAKVALITAVTSYGIPATVAALTLTVGVGPLWAAGGFLLDVAIKLHEAEGFRISQMSALERDIMNYLKTNAPSNYVQINIKEVVQSGLIDRTKCLNFYMDPGFLKAAADSYPSTWNKENGIKFAEYDTNRAQFMSKEAAARDARKNR